MDIHDERLKEMDAEGVEYMLLSLTSPGAQGEKDPVKAANIARNSNDWLSGEVKKNPRRFGGFASLSMHDPSEAALELRRAVKELGMFGALVNDFQTFGDDGAGKKYYDAPEYHVFWEEVERLGVPVYMHPRYPIAQDLEGPHAKWGPRKHLIGAAVSFHLDLSFHIYALCSSGVFDNIPFNLWRADHWYNKPVKKATRPSKEDYSYYFTHNISITTSGDFSTQGLKFCIDQIGVDRYHPYDSIKEAQDWWKSVDLSVDEKDAVARKNAIRIFKLPLDS
ncbi:2,3-dihydroxybenzoate decarboxylase [Cytospora mali]|uniref:2,3-dihydroxybenzoate decarboxylase n=1 Tax=Cytospora mali TaxID=578113 RepID=A0A194VQ56_CYTMA|nr:2,3-dihydroxybenzoate decarboxylase [Valsa mali]